MRVCGPVAGGCKDEVAIAPLALHWHAVRAAKTASVILSRDVDQVIAGAVANAPL